MQDGVSTTLTLYHDGQFWVGLAECIEDGQLSVARIVFGAEPSDQEILEFVSGPAWEKLVFGGKVDAEPAKIAKNPKRRQREASKELQRPSVSTKAQQALSQQREEMKSEAAAERSLRKAEEKQARFEQRTEKRKQKRRGH